MTKEVPARLYILLARHSPLAVVIRRGPSKQVCTVLWNRKNDSFELGQWLKGRIYEKRCDLSPDGKYLLYFAMKGGETYTAVSRAPWLKAIEFYPMIGTWEGGGQFLTENKFWLNVHFQREQLLMQSDELQRNESYEPEVHFSVHEGNLLLRDGWKLSENSEPTDISPIFEKLLPKGWVLKKIANVSMPSTKGMDYFDRDKLELTNKESGSRFECDDWEWADLDGQSVVWASNGCLYRASIESADKIGTPKLLCDFNPLKFERREALY